MRAYKNVPHVGGRHYEVASCWASLDFTLALVMTSGDML